MCQNTMQRNIAQASPEALFQRPSGEAHSDMGASQTDTLVSVPHAKARRSRKWLIYECRISFLLTFLLRIRVDDGEDKQKRLHMTHSHHFFRPVSLLG